MVKQEKEVRIAVEYGKQCDCACRNGRVEVGAPRSRAQWSMIVAWLIGIVLALGEAVALYHAVPGLAAASWLEVKEQTACEAMQHNYWVLGFMASQSSMTGHSLQDHRIKGSKLRAGSNQRNWNSSRS